MIPLLLTINYYDFGGIFVAIIVGILGAMVVILAGISSDNPKLSRKIIFQIISISLYLLVLFIVSISYQGTDFFPELTSEFDPVIVPGGGTAELNSNGGCIAIGTDGRTSAPMKISGRVRSLRDGKVEGWVEGAIVEITGAGAQDLDVTKGGNDAGRFTLQADFNLGGTPFGISIISFKKDGFVRRDLTIAIKANDTCLKGLT